MDSTTRQPAEAYAKPLWGDTTLTCASKNSSWQSSRGKRETLLKGDHKKHQQKGTKGKYTRIWRQKNQTANGFFHMWKIADTDCKTERLYCLQNCEP